MLLSYDLVKTEKQEEPVKSENENQTFKEEIDLFNQRTHIQYNLQFLLIHHNLTSKINFSTTLPQI